MCAIYRQSMALSCLIVDDTPAFLTAARGLLERQGVMVVGTVSTGAEALRHTVQLRPDVVLMDIDLDGESGFDLARLLHSNGAGMPPVILISTHALEDFADVVAESPAIGFLPKISLSAAAIQDLLRRHEDGGQPKAWGDVGG
jgi:DNA-binding NarL/FixJ family response regulator